MVLLKIFIEFMGESRYVGTVSGSDCDDAAFAYSPEYLENPESRAVSIGLPLQESAFSPEKTRIFFEGLLPEGFTRKCVAQWLRTDERDYLAILSALGKECLGAIKVLDASAQTAEASYKALSLADIRALAQEGATQSADLVTKSHLSLTGASGKVGLYLDEAEQKWYQPIGEAPSTHIVKQSHARLKKIVLNELLCLLAARKLGIETPESFVLQSTDEDGKSDAESVLFATKRYDRKLVDSGKKICGLPVPYRLHQEDFAQALNISSADKYEQNGEAYLRKAFEILRKHSSSPIEDRLRLWDICIFNYLVGNTDNHIKNISLLYSADLKSVRLAPAYDIVSTAIYDSSTENMAISIGGEYDIRKITRASFAAEAKNIGLGSQIAMKRFDTMAENFKKALLAAEEELSLRKLPEFSASAGEVTQRILARGGIAMI